MSKVINLYGGPCSGKSTTASSLFARMKKDGYKVELVTEYAKELVYEEASLDNQLKISGEQYERVRRLQGKVDYIITDSPILLGGLYCPRLYRVSLSLVLMQIHSEMDTLDIFLNRSDRYDTYGRTQTHEEARVKDEEIKSIGIPFIEIDKYDVDTILGYLK